MGSPSRAPARCLCGWHPSSSAADRRPGGAHPGQLLDVLSAVYRAQADALEIEAQAKRRLADEYDAAQERGEVADHGGARHFKVPVGNVEPTVADIGLTRKDIHEARQIRNAETADPGIVRRTVRQPAG